MSDNANRLLRWAAAQLASHSKTWEQAELPWRVDRSPFGVFVAEFLLVRTRSDVVARVYQGVIERYPEPEALADADPAELERLLTPLGFRKRTPLLIRAARVLVDDFQGHVPNRREDLLSIPGIGRYTADAIAAFAFAESTVPADVNILRFVARLTGLPMRHPTKGSKELLDLLPDLASAEPRPSPESLLDFTRIVCRPRTPRCNICPLVDRCRYYADHS